MLNQDEINYHRVICAPQPPIPIPVVKRDTEVAAALRCKMKGQRSSRWRLPREYPQRKPIRDRLCDYPARGKETQNRDPCPLSEATLSSPS